MRQIVTTLVMTVVVFAGVLLLGSAIKEVLGVLLNQNTSLVLVARAIGLLIPFILVFALPIGMLTAALLVFGRLSADQELTAMRASGVSLMSLVSPVLLLSVLMCVVCALVNLDFAPRARQAFNQLIFDLGKSNLSRILPPGVFHEFKDAGLTVYIGKESDGELFDVSIYQMEDGKAVLVSRAGRARLEFDAEKELIIVTLFDGHVMDFGDEMPVYFGEGPRLELKFGSQDGARKVPLANMALAELFELRRELLAQGLDLTPVHFQIHSKIAFSFACIGFTLIGIPLGLQTHRRETRIGLLAALLLTGVYYGFFMLGQAWSARPEFYPQFLVWVPNFLFQGIGAWLLYRADHRVH